MSLSQSELVALAYGVVFVFVLLYVAIIAAKLARLDAVVRRLSQEGRRASFIYLDDERRPERAAVRLRTAAETPPTGG